MSFPSESKRAPNAARYVGLYYWCDYWRSWDRVNHVDAKYWYVQSVDLHGTPTGPERKHCTAMHANRFADKPFEVRSGGHHH